MSCIKGSNPFDSASPPVRQSPYPHRLAVHGPAIQNCQSTCRLTTVLGGSTGLANTGSESAR